MTAPNGIRVGRSEEPAPQVCACPAADVALAAYRVTPLLLIPARTGWVGSGAQSEHPVE